MYSITGSEATGYFINNVIGAGTVVDGMPTRIVPANVVYAAVTCTLQILSSCHVGSHIYLVSLSLDLLRVHHLDLSRWWC